MQGIPVYDDINDLYLLTGSHLRTNNPLFHCFDMAETNDLAVNETKPHRTSFYTLALNFGTENLNYTLNSNTFDNPKNFLLCVAPGHVAKWEKKGNWFGFCTFFKAEFLQFNSAINFLQQYPFFNINETNLLDIDKENFETFSSLFLQIIEEQNRNTSYSLEIIRSNFQSILWQVRRIYEQGKQPFSSRTTATALTAQFQFLVNEHFLSLTSVQQYAELLNISSNHLSETIKLTTGKKAKSIITARRLSEAKYLLQYTDLDVAQISNDLNFKEPTHFTKFFKKEMNTTPNLYRANQRSRLSL